MSLETISIILFVVYLCVITGVAWISSRGRSCGSADVDYYLGGRKTPVAVLAFSYVTSSVSAVAFMGDPGVMSQVGWPYYWIVIGIIPGLIIPAVLLMRRMRLQADKLGSLTIPEYLGGRYKSNALRLIIAGVIAIFYIFPLAAQFKGGAILLEKFIHIPFDLSLVIITAIILFYVAAGGLKSVAWTDFAQGFPMMVICVTLLIISLNAVGGFSGLEEKLAQIDPKMLNLTEEEGGAGGMTVSGIIGNFVFWCVIFISQPYLCSRFLAIPDVSRKTIGKFLIISLALTIVLNSFYIVGLTGRVLFPEAEADYLTVTMAINMLPKAAAALMMIGIFAAMVSTATSVLLVVGQAIGRDFYAKTFAKNATAKKEIWVTRIAVTVVALACFFFNYVNPPKFLSIFLYLGLTGIGSCVGVPLFSAIVFKNPSRIGAIVSALCGPISYVLCCYAFNINFWVSCLLSVSISAGAFLLCSLIFPNKENIDIEKMPSEDVLTA